MRNLIEVGHGQLRPINLIKPEARRRIYWTNVSISAKSLGAENVYKNEVNA
jgi:hypothetical protein